MLFLNLEHGWNVNAFSQVRFGVSFFRRQRLLAKLFANGFFQEILFDPEFARRFDQFVVQILDDDAVRLFGTDALDLHLLSQQERGVFGHSAADHFEEQFLLHVFAFGVMSNKANVTHVDALLVHLVGNSFALFDGQRGRKERDLLIENGSGGLQHL